MALLQRILWSELDDEARASALERPAISRAKRVDDAVRAIRDDVAARGDAALYELTERLDGARLSSLRVGERELADAVGAIDREDAACLKRALRNIETFHREQSPRTVDVETEPGVRCRRVVRPLDAVGLYVPGGSAPLVSTLLMLAAPARLAGCRERIVCTPPGPDGKVNVHILAAANLCGVDEVFKVGGAQAIVAMAVGTESIPRVDKIFGPGNAYVAAAKQLVSREAGGPAVDFPAGPSEVLVVADESAEPEFVAADLLSQAEHDEMSQVLLVTSSSALADAVDGALLRQLTELPRREIAERALSCARTVIVPDLGEAVSVANGYAPEHLILNCEGAEALVDSIRHAGAVFVGPWSAEAMGDYASGTNHVLPTYGSARSFGGLTLESFYRTMTVQHVSEAGIAELGSTVERLARIEGLEAHARAVGLRRAAMARGSAR